MSFGKLVLEWTPIILRYLPQIVKAGHDIYALWCTIQGKKENVEQNETVAKAMKLLNQHEDDIERLLQNPEQKRQLLQGLTILMNRINDHDNRQTGRNGYFPSHAKSSSPPEHHAGKGYGASCSSASASGFSSSSFSKSSSKARCFGQCKVCYREYNMTDRRPLLLFCGHTFCQECLEREEGYRRRLSCPMCKRSENRPIPDLPLNYALIDLQDEYQDDDECCKKGASGGASKGASGGASCDVMSMSFEEQMEYVLQLSRQNAENCGADYVEERWRELMQQEDEMLAIAIQDSLIYEDSRLYAEQYSKGATGGGCCSDELKDEWKGDECAKGKANNGDCRSECTRGEWEEDECAKRKFSSGNCGSECAKGKWDESDCCKGEKEACSAMLQEEEDLLIQMAIRMSLETQEEHTAHPDQE